MLNDELSIFCAKNFLFSTLFPMCYIHFGWEKGLEGENAKFQKTNDYFGDEG